MRRIHVVGAGLSGLAAALTAVGAGCKVAVWEAAPRAGGRCRSWTDAAAGAEIDNGTHLALSGNRALRRYLHLAGATDRMVAHRPAAFPFRNVADGSEWTLRPGWRTLLRADARPPGVGAGVLVADCLRLLQAPPEATVAETVGRSPAFTPLWRPLAVSALNAAPEIGAARLLATTLRETLMRGEAACRPMLPRTTLDDALIAPAVAALTAAGADVHFSARVEAIGFDGDAATRLYGPDVRLAPGDALILATPPRAAGELLPGLTPPPAGPAVVNVHFQATLNLPPLLGLCGGQADWLFQGAGVLSATISDADAAATRPAAEIAGRIWAEATTIAGTPGAPLPPFRVVKERRATTSAAPADQNARPGPVTRWKNLFLAGDWTAVGLPSTMEGAVRAGFNGAAACLNG